MASFLKVISDEMKQRELLMDDEEEDFLDECIGQPYCSADHYEIDSWF